MQHTPVLGGTAPQTAQRTARKLSRFALKHVEGLGRADVTDARCLDVGCGNGFITTHLAPAFGSVVGIDIEPERLDEFRHTVHGDPHFKVLWMSADALAFADAAFQLVTSFEVLEHVPDLEKTADEIVRVCSPGGVVAISVPQTGFPFENHGMVVGGRMINHKIPLLPYVRPLHRRLAAARVFSSAELDELFVGRGLELIETAFASPQFERAATQADSWERHFVFLRDFLEWSETVPGLRQVAGVSILKAYRKPTTAASGRPPRFWPPGGAR